MSALAIIAIVLAVGFAGLMIYGGLAMYESAKRPRHGHKWKVLRETVVHSAHSEIANMPVAHILTLQCEGCGDITTRKVKS